MKLTRILRKGMSGEDVKFLQERLIILKYMAGTASEFYNEATFEAALKFQQDHNLRADGVIGGFMWNLLSQDPVVESPVVTTEPVTETNSDGVNEGVTEGATDESPTTETKPKKKATKKKAE